MKTIAIINQKGGVGKTATAITLAAGLAAKGKRTLLVDLDPQASATRACGFQNPDELPATVDGIFTAAGYNTTINIAEIIIHHTEGFDLLPSSLRLANSEMLLQAANVISKETILRRAFASLEYDYLILDCLPAFGLLSINAMTAADEIIIPVRPDYISSVGVSQLFEWIKQVRDGINPGLTIAGILITMSNKRTNEAKRALAELERFAAQNDTEIFAFEVPNSTKVAETYLLGKSIFTHDPAGKAAEAYRDLVDYIAE